jgi:predicted NBD/HSP70 family sugar kinase
MKRCVGIDVAQEQCALCIVDDAGTILFEGSCATDPDEIVRTIAPEVDDVARFGRATDVGAYLGPTLRRHQSSGTDWPGRISKRSDGAFMRQPTS